MYLAELAKIKNQVAAKGPLVLFITSYYFSSLGLLSVSLPSIFITLDASPDTACLNSLSPLPNALPGV